MHAGVVVMHEQNVKHAGDLIATIVTGISLASQWAQMLTPIATLTLTILGIIWWCIRFREWLREEDSTHD